MGQKLIIRFLWESGLLSASRNHHHFLQTFRPLRMFKIVFRDSSLYPKQLSLFCLIMLISASADRIMATLPISVAYELKNSSCNIEAFRHMIMFQQGKRKTKFAGFLYTKNRKFSYVLCAHSQFLRSLAGFHVRASQSSRTLSMLDCPYSTRHQCSLVLQL